MYAIESTPSGGMSEAIMLLQYAIMFCVSAFSMFETKNVAPYCALSFFMMNMFAGIFFLQKLTHWSQWSKWQLEVERAGYYFCFPLLATQFCLTAGVTSEISFLNLVVPIIDYSKRIMSQSSTGATELSQAISIGAIAYCTYMLHRLIGFVVVAIYVLCTAGSQYSRDCKHYYPILNATICLCTVSFVKNVPIENLFFK